MGSLVGTTLVVPQQGTAAAPRLLAAADDSSTAVIANIGGLDLAGATAGPGDMLLLYEGQLVDDLAFGTLLLSGWILSLPLFAAVYAWGIGGAVSVTVAIARTGGR